MARILVLAHRVPFPPNKGEKLRTFHQIEELVKKGHLVTVLAPCESEKEFADAAALSEKFGIEVVCKKLANRFTRLAMAVLKNRSFSETNFYSGDLLAVFKREAPKADAILLTASSLAEYVFALTTPVKAQLLMDFMDVDSDKWRQYASESNAFKRALFEREASKIAKLERIVSEKFDTTFVIAETEKKLFESTIVKKGNLKVLGNGIDQNLFSPSSNIAGYSKPNDQINILFSGVMDYKPNVDAMLWFVASCWPAIVDKIPTAHLVIAGMNPNPEIVKLGSEANIEVTGFVDDIKPYFDKAHIFIAPFQIARGVQNKVLQAMACALPVVSTPLGAEGIICEDKFDILLADSALAFTEKVIALSQDNELRARVGNNALETINANYAWESVLKPLTEVIEPS